MLVVWFSGTGLVKYN